MVVYIIRAPVAGEMIPETSAVLCQLMVRAQELNPRQ